MKAKYNRLLSLRRTVRSLPQYDVPAGLQARIQSALDADRPDQVDRRGRASRPVPAGRPSMPRSLRLPLGMLTISVVYGAADWAAALHVHTSRIHAADAKNRIPGV